MFWKREVNGSEGLITSYAFSPGRKGKRVFLLFAAFSETKWHKGEKYRKTPIWFSFDKKSKTVYIWNIALGFSKVY